MFITSTWSFGPLKKVLTFMATAIPEKSKLTYPLLVLFRENDKLIIEAKKLI